MFQTVIIADQSQPEDAAGNRMVVQVELVPGQSIHAESQVALSLTINTGHPEEGELDTEIYFEMSLEKAAGLSTGIADLIKENYNEQIHTLTKALEFKSAQLACVKGAVGSLTITKVADSDRAGTQGFGFYNLAYSDDQAEPSVLHQVDGIECYVPFLQEEQYEWLRTLVGGNHQFTSSIKVVMVGFTLDQVREDFENSLRTVTEGVKAG